MFPCYSSVGMETAEPEEVMDDSAIFDPPGQLQRRIPSTRGRRSREAMDSLQDMTGWSRHKLETVCKAHAIKGHSGKKREWMLQRVQAVLQVIHSFGIRTSALKTHKFICIRPEHRCIGALHGPVGRRTSTGSRRDSSLSYQSSGFASGSGDLSCQPKVSELCTAALEYNVSRHVRRRNSGFGEQIEARPIGFWQRWF